MTWQVYYDEWLGAKTQDEKKEAMSKLLKLLAPYLQKEANKWKGQLSPFVVDAEVKKLAVEAVKSYKPGMSALPTHITHNIRRVSRLLYSQSGIGRMPEGKILLLGTFKKAWGILQDFHGREPTVVELMDELSWPRNKVEELLKKIRNEGSIDEASVAYITSPDFSNTINNKLDVVYYDLDVRDKLIFEHAYGYGGKSILGTGEMAARLGVSPGFVSQRKSYIDTKIRSTLGGAVWKK